ncbi:hypothetical protein ACH5RR_033819 [Cinchona calisaya]|uniref:Uncharacterized protein n=1 Tax=Cinchona calisaya TaxID=153742 RepID=A0ABD2YAE4_9GENT
MVSDLPKITNTSTRCQFVPNTLQTDKGKGIINSPLMAESLPKTSENEVSSSSEQKGKKLKKKIKTKIKKKEDDIARTILEQFLGEFKNLWKTPISGIMIEQKEDKKEIKKENKTDSTKDPAPQEPEYLENQVSSTDGVDSIGYENVGTTL